MKMIVAIFPTERELKVKEALYSLNIGGFIMGRVTGIGLPRGNEKEQTRRYFELPKTRLEVIVTDPVADVTIKILVDTLHTGRIGDGKLFVVPVEDAIRVRTMERGPAAL